MSDHVTNTVDVSTGQYVALPNTPKFVLPGPGRLLVTRYKDGRLAGQILEGESKPIEFAVAKRLQRVSWGL